MHIFSQLKREKSILGIRWENMAIGTECARNFCARIGPLQLGILLVPYLFTMFLDHLDLVFSIDSIEFSFYNLIQLHVHCTYEYLCRCLSQICAYQSSIRFLFTLPWKYRGHPFYWLHRLFILHTDGQYPHISFLTGMHISCE